LNTAQKGYKHAQSPASNLNNAGDLALKGAGFVDNDRLSKPKCLMVHGAVYTIIIRLFADSRKP
jgi:hypothetical protein